MIHKDDFVKDGCGWNAKASGLQVNGKDVALYISTKTDTEHADRDIFEEQMETLKLISENWGELTQIVVREILAYQSITEEYFFSVFHAPRISLSIDSRTNLPDVDNAWSFIVGVNVEGADDFGWHVEFKGITHTDTWAG